jgi:hypothetical protein
MSRALSMDEKWWRPRGGRFGSDAEYDVPGQSLNATPDTENDVAGGASLPARGRTRRSLDGAQGESRESPNAPLRGGTAPTTRASGVLNPVARG